MRNLLEDLICHPSLVSTEQKLAFNILKSLNKVWWLFIQLRNKVWSILDFGFGINTGQKISATISIFFIPVESVEFSSISQKKPCGRIGENWLPWSINAAHSLLHWTLCHYYENPAKKGSSLCIPHFRFDRASRSIPCGRCPLPFDIIIRTLVYIQFRPS